MNVMVLNASKSIIKAKNAKLQIRAIAFPYAIQQLSEGKHQNIVSRPNSTSENLGYLRINGRNYVVGNNVEKLFYLTYKVVF